MTAVSRLKEIAKLLLPPVVTRSFQYFRPHLTYAPLGWDTPTSAPESAGWNVDAVVAQEQAKWQAFCKNLEGAGPLGFSHEHVDLSLVDDLQFHNVHITFAYVLALAAHLKTTLSLLDWGGGLGHYQRLARALLPQIELQYHCKEVPAMARVGERLNSEVQWHIDERCLDRTYDLVMVNASLQYMRDWREILPRLANAASGYLFLTRIPVVEKGPSFVAVQQAYGTTLLHQQFHRQAVLDLVQTSGMRLVREFVVGDRLIVRGAPEECEMRGWLFEAP